MIKREPIAAQQIDYDLIVVGGGIYGVCVLLEAARCGLRCVLLERDDFGGATSWNSMRIIHGGFRYLQHLDLRRYYESVRERRWFCSHFPDLIKPLTCLLPLYGSGLRSPLIFRLALAVNDILSCCRNRGVSKECRLPRSEMLSVDKTRSMFPRVDSEGLRGGGLWHDAIMVSSERLLIEILHWACYCGATALNYVEAKRLLQTRGNVTGVEAVDHESGRLLQFRAPVVVNCAGPWSRELAKRFDRDVPKLFRKSLAFNLLLNYPPLADVALAVAPKQPGARTYFLVPWKGMIFAGTHHLAWTDKSRNPYPTDVQVDEFLSDLNSSIPGLDISRDHIIRINAGLLPARQDGSYETANREIIFNHASRGGPRGLFSISGVKYTTARLVAQKTICAIGALRNQRFIIQPETERPESSRSIGLEDSLGLQHQDPELVFGQVRSIVQEESVVHLDDLLLRRTEWLLNEQQSRRTVSVVCEMMGWNQDQCKQEMARLLDSWERLARVAGRKL